MPWVAFTAALRHIIVHSSMHGTLGMCSWQLLLDVPQPVPKTRRQVQQAARTFNVVRAVASKAVGREQRLGSSRHTVIVAGNGHCCGQLSRHLQQ